MIGRSTEEKSMIRLLSFLIVFLSMQSLDAASWPRLRGPGGAGTVETAGLAVETRSADLGSEVRGLFYSRDVGSDGSRGKSISIGPTRSSIQRALDRRHSRALSTRPR